MDAHDLVTGVRWNVLRELARQPRSGADLARALNTSAPNVAQHLKLLELGGFITKERVNGKSMHYRVTQEAALVTVLCRTPYRQTMPLDEFNAVELRLLGDKRPEAKLFKRFLVEYEELARGFLAFGSVKEDDDVQLLVLAGDVKHLRKEYANIELGGKKIIIWSHTPEELQEGLERKEKYFTDLLSNLVIYYDPTLLLAKLKEGRP